MGTLETVKNVSSAIGEMGRQAFAQMRGIDDAFVLLSAQHREVEELFKEIEAADENFQRKKRLGAVVCEKILMHAHLEEKYLYPVLTQYEPQLAYEAIEEHAAVKNVIKKLQAEQDNEDQFDGRMCVLKEFIEHHVKEEEEEIFPQLRSELDEDTYETLSHKMVNAARAYEEGKRPAPKKAKASARTATRTASKAKRSGKGSRGRRSMKH